MSQVIDLQTKITQKGLWKSVELSTIHLRPAVARDLIGLDMVGAQMQQSLAVLISRLSGLPLDTILSIEVSDYMKICDRVSKMISGGK